MIPVTHFLYLASGLFLLGFAGLLLRRNFVVQLLSAALMLSSGVLVLASGSRYWVNGSGQSFAFLVGFLTLAQVMVGAALVLGSRGTVRPNPPSQDH